MLDIIESEFLDLDWFAMDSTGLIAHFATAGCGAIPFNFPHAIADLELLMRFFSDLKALDNNNVWLNPQLDKIVSLPTTDAVTEYVASFSQMASKGVASYDASSLGVRPSGYHIVGRPASWLHVDTLPEEIRKLLAKVSLKNISFPIADSIAAEVVLNGVSTAADNR